MEQLLGGIVTDSGNFDWRRGDFPLFNEPDPNYHGIRWAYDLPQELSPIAFALRLRTVPLRNLGAAISPDNAWMFLQGLETLPIRMERHSENAMKVAQFLQQDDRVAWVRYPGLPEDPSYSTATRYLKKGYGGMVVFGIKGGYNAAIKLIDSIELFFSSCKCGRCEEFNPSSSIYFPFTDE